MINAAGSEVGRFLRRDVLAFRNQISLRALAFLLNAVLHVVDEFLLQFGMPLVAPPDQRIFNLPGTFRDDFFDDQVALVVGGHGVDADPRILLG